MPPTDFRRSSAGMSAVLPVSILANSRVMSQPTATTLTDVSEAERKRVRRALAKYCGQDTEGMVRILDALKRG
jgi:hypothetical protein